MAQFRNNKRDFRPQMYLACFNLHTFHPTATILGNERTNVSKFRFLWKTRSTILSPSRMRYSCNGHSRCRYGSIHANRFDGEGEYSNEMEGTSTIKDLHEVRSSYPCMLKLRGNAQMIGYMLPSIPTRTYRLSILMNILSWCNKNLISV